MTGQSLENRKQRMSDKSVTIEEKVRNNSFKLSLL